MRYNTDLMGEGYAAQLRDRIEKGGAAVTYLNAYDLTVLKQKYGYLDGIEKEGNHSSQDEEYIIELTFDRPQLGNYFKTRIVVDNSVPRGMPRFAEIYPNEEILWYTLIGPLIDEDGMLLSEEGEMLVC